MITVRKVKKRHWALGAAVACAVRIMAQVPDKVEKAVLPMDIPLFLSGNFMEPRIGHFHSGIDIKTNGVEGVPVRAVKEGFVSRIRVSAWGYGKALYVQHPDGTTTVYGHLGRFEPTINEAALRLHYGQKSFEIDQPIDPGVLPVKRGEVIAWSGNTGGSSAPHLHFEVRRTSDQHALDPEANGVDLTDDIAPDIVGVRLYALDSTSLTCPYPGKAKGFAAELRNGTYKLDPEARLAAYGTVGLAVHAIDRYNGTSNTCGVRSIELLVDSVKAFSVHLDEIDFDLNRYCDAHMDFGLEKGSDMYYHRLYKLPNNPLALYGPEPLQGRITLQAGRTYRIGVVVVDANGNRSSLVFDLRGATLEEARAWPTPMAQGTPFRNDRENRIARDGFRLVVPASSLYDDLDFRYTRSAAPKGALCALHIVHDPLTPLRLPAQLSLRADSVPERLRSKTLIVRLDAGGKISPQGGTWENGWVTAKVRAFGNYTVLLDSVAPKITPLDLRADMKGRGGFAIRVADDLSGPDKWTATLDGKWILMEYEPKDKTLVHTFDSRSEGAGERSFKLDVTDERGNTAHYSFTFTR